MGVRKLCCCLLLVCCLAARVTAVTVENPQRYLEDKQAALLAGNAVLAIVQVDHVVDDWLVVEGDWYPYHVVSLSMVERLAGADVPAKVAVMFGRPCPGQSYLMYAVRQGTSVRLTDVPLDWVSAEFRNLLGSGTDSSILWAPTGWSSPTENASPAFYRIADLRNWLHDHAQEVPLDGLLSSTLRLERAEELVRKHGPWEVAGLAKALDPVVRGADGQAAYRALAVLMEAGVARPSIRPELVSALRSYRELPSERLRLAAACALAELGSPDGRSILMAAGHRVGAAMSSEAQGAGAVMTPGLFHYDDGAASLSAAYYLGRLGDASGLADPDPKVRLAAASGLGNRFRERTRLVLRAIQASLAPQVATLLRQGKLKTRRAPGDVLDRWPMNWVKATSLLAWAGSDTDLKALVDVWLQDASSYPPGKNLVGDVESIVYEGTPHSADWPSLTAAILESDVDRGHLAVRLRRLYPLQWQSQIMAPWRTLSGAGVARARPSPSPAEANHHDEVLKLLAATDSNSRQQGLAAAGKFRYADLYERVFKVAATDPGIEGSAALFGLNLYHRAIAPDEGRHLLAVGDVDRQLNALELVTRTEPEAFQDAIWQILGTAAGQSQYRTDANDSRARSAVMVLARLFRTRLPQTEVVTAAPRVLQLWVIQGLYESGNPAVTGLLERLQESPDATVRREANAALTAENPLAVTAPASPAPAPGGILTIFGIKPGDSESEVREKWKASVRRDEGAYFEFFPTESRDPLTAASVTFQGGRVVKVDGEQLELDGGVVLRKGDTLATVIARLGEPDESSYDTAKPTIGWVRYTDRGLFVSISPAEGVSFVQLVH